MNANKCKNCAEAPLPCHGCQMRALQGSSGPVSKCECGCLRRASCPWCAPRARRPRRAAAPASPAPESTAAPKEAAEEPAPPASLPGDQLARRRSLGPPPPKPKKDPKPMGRPPIEGRPKERVPYKRSQRMLEEAARTPEQEKSELLAAARLQAREARSFSSAFSPEEKASRLANLQDLPRAARDSNLPLCAFCTRGRASEEAWTGWTCSSDAWTRCRPLDPHEGAWRPYFKPSQG